ncbi:hypothetical protein [Hugenholtzia roseola]|uniref:hypothetical protein n=1 Tax=Hugenholtzia roseola TaxID=1002 RepID=UPI00042A42CA|nr:hypothetical protein [Hugenholtzia roseola]
MQIEQLKLALIEWILETQSRQLLDALWEWKAAQKAERERRFFALCGSWQSDQTGDELAQEIYNARNDQPRDIIL